MNKSIIIAAARIKVMLRNPGLIIMCILLPLVFYVFSIKVIDVSDEAMKVPIAIVDYDNTNTSRWVVESVQDNSLFNCILTEESNGLKLLKKEEIQGLYIIKEGFEENIKQENINELLKVYYLAGNKIATAISDVIAGEIIPVICTNKSANSVEAYYKENTNINNKNVRSDVIKLIQNNIGQGKYDLPVNTEVRFPGEKKEQLREISQGIVLKQWILGIFLIFIFLYLVFNCTALIKERVNRVHNRIIVSGCTYFQLYLGDLIGLSSIGLVLNLLQVAMFYFILNLSLKSLVYIFIVNLFFIYCISCMLILLTKVFKSNSAFQSFIPMLVLFLGLIGGCFFSLELLPDIFKRLSVITPTYWAHGAMSRIVLYNISIESIYKNIIMLFLYGIVFTFIDYVIYGRSYS